MEAAYFKTWNNHIPRTPIDIQNNEFVVNRTKNIIEFVTGLTYENYNVKSRRSKAIIFLLSSSKFNTFFKVNWRII
jgi:hypothetical protein